MSRVRFGIVAGLVFGLVDALPMFAMDIPDRGMAIAAAFLNRSAIGFLIPNLSIKMPGWFRGVLVGFLVSLPEAIITRVWGPILGIGVVGGAVIGIILGRWEAREAASE
ncbi:MAG: hypothetical protein ABIE42_05915 [Candidatus Eisenbacteria bacterium]